MIKIKNYGNSADIIIHGDIIDDADGNWLKLLAGSDEVIGYVWPDKVRKELDELKGIPLNVHIASDGGSVQAGTTLANFLKNHDAPVVTYIDSWAASIASVIAFAGSKIVMAGNTYLMIHNPSGGAVGTADYLRSVATFLDKIRDNIAKTYASKSEKDEAYFLDLMDKETWLTASECKELFGDYVELLEDNADLAAVACFSGFENAPDALNMEKVKMQQEAEKQAKLEADKKYIMQVIEKSLGGTQA